MPSMRLAGAAVRAGITEQIGVADSGTGTDTISIMRNVGLDAVVYAEPAEALGEALPPTVQTVQAYGIPSEAQMGSPTVISGNRIIRDHLVVQGRSLWWTQLTEKGGWMLQVVDEAGEEGDRHRGLVRPS